MSKLFLDTSFVQAQINNSDQFHAQALRCTPLLQTASEVWITEIVLIEIADGLSAINRVAAIRFIDRCYNDSKVQVVNVSSLLFAKATELYRSRTDKTWGMTDCISFVVMEEQNLTEALTSDRHFIQAGYRALLLEQN